MHNNEQTFPQSISWNHFIFNLQAQMKPGQYLHPPCDWELTLPQYNLNTGNAFGLAAKLPAYLET